MPTTSARSSLSGYFAELSGVLSVAGRSVAMLLGPKLSADDYQGHYRRLAVAQKVLARLGMPAASGSNMLVTAKAFAAVGGFDTDLTCNEDSELGWRIARAGFAWRCDSRLITFATDHRRLRNGVLRKTLHTVLRCSALYLGIVPRRWRAHDWGYWREFPNRPRARASGQVPLDGSSARGARAPAK